MPKGYIGSSLKYASTEQDALKHLGSKPDKNGFMRFKKGGIARIKNISIINESNY